MTVVHRRQEETRSPEFSQRGTKHHARGNFDERYARCFGHERNRAARTRVRLDHIHLAPRHGELHVDQATHVECIGDRLRIGLDDFDDPRFEGRWRNGTSRVAGVHASFLYVLHHSANQHFTGGIANRIDVDFCCVVEEPIDEDRSLRTQSTLTTERSRGGHLGHCSSQMALVVHDLHRATTKHVTRANEHRIPDSTRDFQRFFDRQRSATWWLFDVEGSTQCIPLLSIFCEIDRGRRRSGDEMSRDLPRKLERSLSSETDDDAWLPTRSCHFSFDHVHHVFVCQWLEVQAIRGVVVGGDRLRVAVHHDRFEPCITESETRMHAAVVELDSLTDAIRATTEDDHLRLVGRSHLGLIFVR